MNKRAMNQVEYISAMLIFLFGVIVIMYFALTFNLTQHKDYLTSIENNLKKETEITYSEYHLSPGETGGCYKITSASFPTNLDPSELTVLLGQTKKGYKVESGYLFVEGGPGDYTFRISPNESQGNSVSQDCSELSEPKFSFEEKFNALSYDKLRNFQEIYFSNYTSLKEIIAENRDFNIEIENITGCGDINFKGMTISRYIPRNVEVTAGEFPAKLFITSEVICDVKVMIKIWNT